MMVRRSVVLAAMLLVGCGQREIKQTTEKLNTFDVAEPPAETPTSSATKSQIAYSYTVSYAFDRSNVAEVQGEQLALCRGLGGAKCMVVRSSLRTPGPNERFATDHAVLLVDARIATDVNRRLDALATKGGARLSERQSTAEDVTRQVIDADARVGAKQALAERLLAIIRSGKGNVGELVQAERAYSTTQEELDAARQERASLTQRVAMSSVTIDYIYDESLASSSVIGASLRSAGDTLSNSIATLVTAIVAGLPWLVVGMPLLLLFGRIFRKPGWRLPRWRRDRGEG